MNTAVSILPTCTSILIAATALLARKRAIEERTRARNETSIVVAQLEMRICELQQRSREISLLAELNEMLHLSHGVLEATEILPSFGRRLFPTFDGAVYVHGDAGDEVELSSWWGTAPDVESFVKDACWGLRRSHSHIANGDDVMCAHHRTGDTSERLCVPMLAFGDAIGVLTLRASSPANAAENIELVARAFADQLALAVASLRMQETLRTRAVRDALTGLFNRHYLKDALSREVGRCRDGGAPVSVIVFDIDHFKSFNDTFGHAGGDAALQQVARLVRNVVTDEDVVCRYGGEEFVVMLPNTPLDAAVACANRIRDQIRSFQPHLADQRLGEVTISAGVATSPEHGIEPEKLLAAADRALYAAKNAGRDRVHAASSIQVVGRDAA